MQIFTRSKDGSTELTTPIVPGDDKILLAIGGMTATNEKAATPLSMLGGYKSFSDSLIESSNMTITAEFLGDGARKASGFAKIAEELLGGAGIHDKGIKLLGVSFESVQQNIANMILGNKFDNYSTHESMELANQIVLPLIADNATAGKTVGGWNITGDRLPMDEAKERLNNLTVFAQSNGTNIARMLENSMQYQMEQLGYSADERRDLTSQVTMLGTGNVSRIQDLDIKSSHFNAVFMESNTDKVIEMLNDYRAPVALENEAMKVSVLPTSLLVTVTTPESLSLPHTQTGEPVDFTDSATHHVWQYTKRNLNAEPNNDVNAQIVENVLRNMVTRDIDFEIIEMFDRAKPLAKEMPEKSSSHVQNIIDVAVGEARGR